MSIECESPFVGGEWAEVEVEVMGHRAHFGYVKQITFAGVPMVEILVPDGSAGVAGSLRYAGAALLGVHPMEEADVRRLVAGRPFSVPGVYRPDLQYTLPAMMEKADEKSDDGPPPAEGVEAPQVSESVPESDQQPCSICGDTALLSQQFAPRICAKTSCYIAAGLTTHRFTQRAACDRCGLTFVPMMAPGDHSECKPVECSFCRHFLACPRVAVHRATPGACSMVHADFDPPTCTCPASAEPTAPGQKDIEEPLPAGQPLSGLHPDDCRCSACDIPF